MPRNSLPSLRARIRNESYTRPQCLLGFITALASRSVLPATREQQGPSTTAPHPYAVLLRNSPASPCRCRGPAPLPAPTRRPTSCDPRRLCVCTTFLLLTMYANRTHTGLRRGVFSAFVG